MSDVDERLSMGMLASPLLMQKRVASAAPAIFYHLNRESSFSRSSRTSECTHTHLLHEHFSAHSACTFCLRTSAHLHACAHTRMTQVPEKVCCMRVSLISIWSSPFSCFTIICLCCSLTVTSRPFPTLTFTIFLPVVTRPKKRGSSALPHERRGVWLLGQVRSSHTERRETCCDEVTPTDIEPRPQGHTGVTFRKRKNGCRASRKITGRKSSRRRRGRQPYQDSLKQSILRDYYFLKRK